MPLSPQYTWDETEKAVTVVVTAPGLSKAKTDLLISDLQIRVSSQPYLLQLDLRHEVDESQYSAVFGGSQLTLRLAKVVNGTWGELTASGSKAHLHTRRNASLQRLECRLQAEQQANLQRKQQLDRDATDRRIELDRQKRDAIEKLKKQELDAQRDQVASWQSNITATDGGESDYENDNEIASSTAAGVDHDQYHGRGYQHSQSTQQSTAEGLPSISQTTSAERAVQQPLQEAIWDSQPGAKIELAGSMAEGGQASLDDNSRHAVRQYDAGSKEARQHAVPVRARCETVEVSFTQLETDHLPARATREQEISAHKAQAKVHEAKEDDVDISERQPLFLKDKGDSMHKAGNYRAALNAYSKALKMDTSLTACYCNRSLTHMKLQDYRACIADLTTALAQLDASSSSDAVQSSPAAAAAVKNMMLKALVRRATAYSQMLDLPAAAADLAKALKVQPSNEQVRLDLSEVQACLSAVDGPSVKSMGDQRFKSKDLQGATEAYTVVLDLSDASAGDKLAAASNRAACNLALAQYSSTIADCHLALKLLTGQDAKALDAPTWLKSQGTQQMTNQQQETLARLLARRGAAQGHLRRYNAAAVDLQAAQNIYTSTGNPGRAAALEADMHKMNSLAAAGSG